MLLAHTPKHPHYSVSPTKLSGLTLIELVVTVTLIGILVAWGVPEFNSWIRNTQVRSVAEALQNGLRTAQTEAVRRTQGVVLTFTSDANPKENPTKTAGGKNWSIQTILSPLVYEDGNSPEIEFIKSGVFADVASSVNIVTAPTASIKTICFNANGRLFTPIGSPSDECPSGARIFFEVAQASSSTTQKKVDRPLKVYLEVGGKVGLCDPKRPTLSDTTPDGCPPAT
jgi:type IV fimbrial biogenesis protein FimT